MGEKEQLDQFQLSEVDVLSVCLVQAGAIGEDFFLTKSDGGGSMADEKKDVEVIDGEKLFDRIGKFIDEKLAKMRAEADTEEVEKEVPVAESDDVQTELSVEEDKGDKTVTKEVEKQDVELEAETEVKVEAPEEKHTEPDLAVQLAEIQKSLETKYEDVIKGLQDKVVGLEKKNADTEETAERKEFVEKARDFRALPGKYPEKSLGERRLRLVYSIAEGGR